VAQPRLHGAGTPFEQCRGAQRRNNVVALAFRLDIVVLVHDGDILTFCRADYVRGGRQPCRGGREAVVWRCCASDVGNGLPDGAPSSTCAPSSAWSHPR
jgi:hypothetical protein